MPDSAPSWRQKVIWTCWFQGRDAAPPLVQRCLESWERHNPDWDVRCLDARTVQRYIDVREHINLETQTITSASLADIIRILLLHEYGGVWVDATLFCNRRLSSWLPAVTNSGFFAFANPAPDRPLATWFLFAERGNRLVDRWAGQTLQYWKDRQQSDDYFWFHHLFRSLCESDETARRDWARVPKISADGPHSIQFSGRMYHMSKEVVSDLDWTTPVFKLTYRFDEQKYKPGCLLHYLLESNRNAKSTITPTSSQYHCEQPEPRTFAALSVSTENLGDHIQIIAGLRLLARLGIEPDFFIDRDDEITTAARLSQEDKPVGILMNGWFKTNREQWPPHPALAPLFMGFHTRLFQCPELISEEAINYYRRHEPIGCRDVYTQTLLTSNGVDAFLSNCLSLTFPRRMEDPARQTEVFVVSRDDHLSKAVPPSLGAHTFLRHYSGTTDFEDNMKRARALLETYRNHARLIVTTLLHCALPAIAMGIPVVVFYPLNNKAGHASDRERFSSLERMTRVYHLSEMDEVDWSPVPVDVSCIKLDILDRFYDMATRWRKSSSPLGPIAPSSALPVP